MSTLTFELSDADVDRIAAAVVERLRDSAPVDHLMDTEAAARYVGVAPATLRRWAAERSIPFEQEAPGCKLHFHAADLDARRLGGR